MQVPLISSLALALAIVSAAPPALAERPCTRRASLHVDVAPTPFDPPLAKLLFAQLFHELDEPDAGGPCLPGDSKLGSDAHVSVTWPDANHAEVLVEIHEPYGRRSVVRVVDLTKVPADGRSLAVTIAASESFDEIRAQLEAARPTTPSPPVPSSTAPRKPKLRPWVYLGGLGSELAVHAFTRGVTLVGNDARLSIALSTKLEAGIRLGVRAPAFDHSAPGESTYVFGAEVGASPWSLSCPWGLSAKARIDGLSMPTVDGGRTVVVVPAVGAGVWFDPSTRVRFAFEALVGAPVSSSEAARATGLTVGGGLLLAVSF